MRHSWTSCSCTQPSTLHGSIPCIDIEDCRQIQLNLVFTLLPNVKRVMISAFHHARNSTFHSRLHSRMSPQGYWNVCAYDVISADFLCPLYPLYCMSGPSFLAQGMVLPFWSYLMMVPWWLQFYNFIFSA